MNTARARALAATLVLAGGSVVVGAGIVAAPTTLTSPAVVGEPGGTAAPEAPPEAPATACRLGPAGAPCGSDPVQVKQPAGDPDLPGCPADAARAAVVDKTAQRFWLCTDGVPSTDARPMTSGSEAYGLPPIGTHKVFARNVVATGIGGERLNRFVAFYTTPRGNRIAFHEYVHQPESTVGDLDRRGESSGCLRVTTADSWLVWDFLEIGDPVVVITP